MNVSHRNNCSVTLYSISGDYNQLFPAVYITALVLGLPGNLAALYVFISKATPRTSSNVYIINLALADTAILCTLPFRIHYHMNRSQWIFGDTACLITGSLFYANIYISICFMTCICIDRYIATVHPHSYLRVRNSCCSITVSAVIWAVYLVATVVFILKGPLKTKSSAQHCFENLTEDEWDKRMAPYSAVSLVFGSVLTSGIVLVCYPLAARRIAQIGSKTAARAVRIINSILAITLVCFVPYHVLHLLHLLHHLNVIQLCAHVRAICHGRRVTIALVTLNTCLDPLIYYATSSHCKWKEFVFKKRRFRRTKGIYTINIT